MGRGRLAMGLALSLAVLGSCDMADFGRQSGGEPMIVASPPRPEPNPAGLSRPLRSEPLATSEELARRYDQFEARLLSQGLLRADTGAEIDLTADQLATNFIRIALYDEYSPVNGQFVAQETTSRLRRWEDPIDLAVHFGPSVPDTQITTDLRTVEPLLVSLSEASNVPITLTDGPANFNVFVVNETERLELRSDLRRLIPGISNDVMATVLDIFPTTFCLAVAFSEPAAPHVYSQVVAIIRAEHPALLREACFHEEIAQGLGLANDSRDVRPSIFNDDEEFARLTEHDRLLLQMLYDERLTPGMDVTAAEPLVRTIAAELLESPVQTSQVVPSNPSPVADIQTP